jgi:hypothetical protein
MMEHWNIGILGSTEEPKNELFFKTHYSNIP